MSFFDDDICLCGNADLCPKQKECRRGDRRVGIHTYSNFYKENEKCEYFMKRGEYHRA